jgi:hypothetical protein
VCPLASFISVYNELGILAAPRDQIACDCLAPFHADNRAALRAGNQIVRNQSGAGTRDDGSGDAVTGLPDDIAGYRNVSQVRTPARLPSMSARCCGRFARPASWIFTSAR